MLWRGPAVRRLSLVVLLAGLACERQAAEEQAPAGPQAAPPRASQVPAAIGSSDEPALSALAPLPEGLKSATGATVLDYIKQSHAKGVLVNVWASWCGSCKAEIPLLLETKAKYEPLGIEVLFVSVDEPKKAEDALKFAKEQNLPLPAPLVRGQLAPFKRAMSPDWRGSLPASFLFDATGKLRYFWGAQVYEHELVPILDGFLAGENIDGIANVMIKSTPAPP